MWHFIEKKNLAMRGRNKGIILIYKSLSMFKFKMYFFNIGVI